MVDLIALGVLAAGAWHGWRRGTLLMVLAFAGLFAGYIGALVLARPLGRLIADTGAVPPLVAVPLAGLAGFLLFSLVNRILTWRVERRRRAAVRAGADFPLPDHAVGAALGAASAAALLIAAAWAAVNLQRVIPTMPAVDRSLTGRAAIAVAGRAAALVAGRALGDRFSANVVARLVANPAQAVPTLNAALQSPAVHRLVADPGLRTAVLGGNTETLAAHPAVRMLANDSAFRRAAREFGLSDAAADPARLAADLSRELGPMLRAVESVRTNPEMRRLLDDPELQQRLRTGDVQALLTDRRVTTLLAELRGALRQ